MERVTVGTFISYRDMDITSVTLSFQMPPPGVKGPSRQSEESAPLNWARNGAFGLGAHRRYQLSWLNRACRRALTLALADADGCTPSAT